jgi:hypothetical protein
LNAAMPGCFEFVLASERGCVVAFAWSDGFVGDGAGR